MDIILKLLMDLFLKLLMDIIPRLLMNLVLGLFMDLILKLLMDLILDLPMELILSQLFTASNSCVHSTMKFFFVAGWRWGVCYWCRLDWRLVSDIMYLEVYDFIGCERTFYFLHCMVCLSCNTIRMGNVFYNCSIHSFSAYVQMCTYEFAFYVMTSNNKIRRWA